MATKTNRQALIEEAIRDAEAAERAAQEAVWTLQRLERDEDPLADRGTLAQDLERILRECRPMVSDADWQLTADIDDALREIANL